MESGGMWVLWIIGSTIGKLSCFFFMARSGDSNWSPYAGFLQASSWLPSQRRETASELSWLIGANNMKLSCARSESESQK